MAVLLNQLVYRMQSVNLAAFYNYVPGPYEGEIISFRSEGGDPFDLNMSKGSGGWEIASGHPVYIDKVPGDHSSMLRAPHVGELARKVEMQLDGVE